MLHLIKLAVGVRDLAHLAEIQTARAEANPPLRHQTRNAPKRAAELLAGGSIYWVIARAILVRQNLLAITQGVWDDGSPCTALHLHPSLVPVAPRPCKPFQGWRYLAPQDAPPDLAAAAAAGAEHLPPEMRLALTHLALL